ncbi:folylpolyglutamate synthase/dihydrofolate synthase family protein [Evansella sp. AB-rgal1]|uniref:bifunctional folylpolyglutamate synthase/dihydrofolate synthase n=1 Tax=Evansella sp. AB-rgal1 TaxID=3242696 RepID=UPI00359D63EF
MIITYMDAVSYLHSKKNAGIRFDLQRMELLMEKLRHPERKVKTIHVAGTNGKGSTVTYIRSILEETGLFVGTYMTPVFGEEREQIAINNVPMSEEDFLLVIQEIHESVEETEKELQDKVSEFELMTTIAYYYFSYKKPVDIAVIETGMGGRNDATNVILPLVSVITNVNYDHQAFLGNSIEEIASEKAGIIKPGIPIMTSCTDAPLNVLQEEAKKKKSTLYSLFDRATFETANDNGVQTLSYNTPYRQLSNIRLCMKGKHQAINAALAIMTVDYLHQFYAVLVENEQIITGLSRATLEGRLEIIRKDPTIIIDTAHNPDAVKKTVETFQQFDDKRVDILFAAMKDKKVEEMLPLFEAITPNVFVTSFEAERAFPLDEFKKFPTIGNEHMIEQPVQWVKTWHDQAKRDDILLITGSHFFVGEMKKKLMI